LKIFNAWLACPLLACLLLDGRGAWADEGMWPLQLLPANTVHQEYGVDLTPEWLARVRGASVRLANCSAAFVSADGLLMTNQHCIRNCLAERSSRRQDLITDGYVAPARERELPCSSQVADVLLDTQDVTATVITATRNLDARAANVARNKALTRLEQACAEQSRITDPGATIVCESVPLYAGGQYYIYRYRRYMDLRLVFAPELAIAAFGGDPDNLAAAGDAGRRAAACDPARFRTARPSHRVRAGPPGQCPHRADGPDLAGERAEDPTAPTRRAARHRVLQSAASRGKRFAGALRFPVTRQP
jgi:hypothetical protein